MSHRSSGTTGRESDTTTPPLGNGGPAAVNETSNTKGSGDDVTDGTCVVDAVSALLPVIERVGEILARSVTELEGEIEALLVEPIGSETVAVCDGLFRWALGLVDSVELVVWLDVALILDERVRLPD